jgi:5-methylcytosine-specific restriction endonuclease McrA
MNRWNIPEWLEREVIERDRSCVYCGVSFSGQGASRRESPSWEHIINDERIVTRENIVRCCIGCNASKGAKALLEWLESKYCRDRGISSDSVAPIVRRFIEAISRTEHIGA